MNLPLVSRIGNFCWIEYVSASSSARSGTCTKPIVSWIELLWGRAQCQCLYICTCTTEASKLIHLSSSIIFAVIAVAVSIEVVKSAGLIERLLVGAPSRRNCFCCCSSASSSKSSLSKNSIFSVWLAQLVTQNQRPRRKRDRCTLRQL